MKNINVSVTKEFNFEAAHFLPNYNGKCSRLHGHSYFGEVTVSGKINPISGMVIDFKLLGQYIKNMIDLIDHEYLNEVKSFDFPYEKPTAENMAVWMLTFLKSKIDDKDKIVKSIKLYETKDNYAFVEDTNLVEIENKSEYCKDEYEEKENDDCFEHEEKLKNSIKELKKKFENDLKELVDTMKNIRITVTKKDKE